MNYLHVYYNVRIVDLEKIKCTWSWHFLHPHPDLSIARCLESKFARPFPIATPNNCTNKQVWRVVSFSGIKSGVAGAQIDSYKTNSEEKKKKKPSDIDETIASD